MRPHARPPRAPFALSYIALIALGILAPPAAATAQELTDRPTAAETQEADKGDDREIVAVPDRPGFSTSAYTTPAGHAQVEAGVSTVVDGGDVSLVLPSLLVRIGIAESFELGAGFPSFEVGFEDEENTTALGDAQLTAKWAIPVGEHAAVGMLPFLTIPVDGDGVDDSVTFGGLFLWQVQASDRVQVFSNIGAFTGPDPSKSGTAFGGVTSAGLSFALSDAWGAYVEGFSYFGSGEGIDPVADAGFTYAVLPWLIVDAWGGFGFSESTVLGGLGIALAR